jgi:hypothetical protein
VVLHRQERSATKRFSKLLGTLWSIAISKSSAATEGAPVLTVPVAR